MERWKNQDFYYPSNYFTRGFDLAPAAPVLCVCVVEGDFREGGEKGTGSRGEGKQFPGQGRWGVDFAKKQTQFLVLPSACLPSAFACL